MCDSRIFNAAVKLSPERRAAYLDQACGTDPSLRGDVESLLRAHEDPDSFLRSQPQATVEHGAVAEQPGTLIGPYKLLQQIGEGGMGVVYMAEQQTPVRRRVALKVIKPGMDSAQVIARFEAERQALAMMDHQNIAKVLDAGTIGFVVPPSGGSLNPEEDRLKAELRTGRPYFVMELVHGVPLTKYCDDHQLTPRQRLELFIPVCHAVQHAHQKGIIHRDLKPSNILVTMYDDLPVPKVIDFGVAKAVEQRLTEKTLFTQFGTLVGTFEYMSPEQAEPNAFGVDTRSDVYSLGVLLYELLTGSTPLERQRLREAAYGEIVRLIKEEDPPRPSTRLSSSGAALAGISHQRGSEPGQLTKVVRGELDWIVMRCLEKNRTRRYETANGLARDVERYLRDEPVEACPPTAGYRLRKFARTHRRLLATAAGFAALLLLGVAASSWQAVRATQAETVATANAVQAHEKEQEAQQERVEVKALNEQLQRTLYAAHINLAHNAWATASIEQTRELLEKHRPKPGETDLRDFEWHYLNRLCHSELLTLKVQAGPGGRVAFSPDGKRLASASRNGTVKVWDAQTGQELLDLKGGGHREAAFSPDGQRLASPSADNMVVKVWDARTGQELLSLKGHTGNVTSVAFSPDGKRVATGSGDNTAKVWDAQTGQELLTIKGGLYSVIFSPDSKRLASASGDNTVGVKVWDAQTGQELLSVKAGGSSVAFSPDGKRLVISRRGGVKVWDAQSGQELLDLKGHDGQINGVAYSPDGKRLASAGGDRTVKVWDAQTGQQLFTLMGHANMVSSVAFNPDGTRLASAALDGTVKVWDATTSPEARTFTTPPFSIGSVAFSPDGKRLASDGAIWNATTQTAVAPELKVWDAQTGQELLSIKGEVGSVVFSPDGKRLAGTSDNTTVKVWDAQTGQELLALKGHTAAVRDVVFRPDGKHLASVSGSRQGGVGLGEVKVWDAQTGQEILTIKGSIGRRGRVAYSPDGQRLASNSGGEVRVWDAQTGRELLTLKGGGNCVAFSPDGKRLASNSRASDSNAFPGAIGEVKVWDAQTGQELLTLKGHTAEVFSVAFSPDGKRLVSGSTNVTGGQNAEVKVWDAQTGQELLTLKGASTRVVFSPDGKRLASNADGTLKIYDATPLPPK